MSDKTKKAGKEGQGPDARLERLVFEAGRTLGWTIPVTIEEVERAEKELEATRVELPESLKDPDALFRARFSGNKRPLCVRRPQSSPVNKEATDNLARAAREGGSIPPDVEERMKRDRVRAEEEDDEG